MVYRDNESSYDPKYPMNDMNPGTGLLSIEERMRFMQREKFSRRIFLTEFVTEHNKSAKNIVNFCLIIKHCTLA